MKRVMISDLKAHLSAYLAAVKDGETVIVCDRNTPIARIEPVEKYAGPEIRKAILPLEALKDLKPVQLPEGVDIQAILAEVRDDR